MPELVEPERIAHDLDGEAVGTPDGCVICVSCHSRTDLAAGLGSDPNPHSDQFIAYATDSPRGIITRRIFCMDCGDRVVDVETEGGVEAMVELTIEYIGLSHPPCMIVEVDVLDISQP